MTEKYNSDGTISLDGSGVKILRLLDPQGDPDVIECDGMRYVPERTCKMVPMWNEPDANGYIVCECDICGWRADYAADSDPVGWCAGCGSKVVSNGKEMW